MLDKVDGPGGALMALILEGPLSKVEGSGGALRALVQSLIVGRILGH